MRQRLSALLRGETALAAAGTRCNHPTTNRRTVGEATEKAGERMYHHETEQHTWQSELQLYLSEQATGWTRERPKIT
jgi:hypothetical protein